MMHSLLFEVVVNFLLGGLLGVLGGLFGIGGGLIAIPVLGVLYGMDQQMAQGTALVMIVPNVMLGFWRYRQRNQIAFTLALKMAIPAVLTTYAAARFATTMGAHSLRLAFAVFMLILASYYLWTLLSKISATRTNGIVSQKYIALVGLGSGLSAGLFSVGGAVVAVPALVSLFGLTQTAAQGLGLAMVTPGTLVALWTYANAGHVNWVVGVPMAAGGVISISWGVALAHHLSERRLRLLFCLALLAIAVSMMCQ